MSSISQGQNSSTPSSRRHDLDALRAAAMLLGVILHVVLAFAPVPWPVQEGQQSPIFALAFVSIHGFRMPLFFLISGFFTAMLWQKRGLKALLQHRVQRIVMPMLLAGCTVLPLTIWAIDVAHNMEPPQVEYHDDLIGAIHKQDVKAVQQHLRDGANANAQDEMGVRALVWATMMGDSELVTLLLEHGADVNARNRDGATALHAAALFGQPAAARILLERGANPNMQNTAGLTPELVCRTDYELTQIVIAVAKLAPRSEKQLEEGRQQIRDLLAHADVNRDFGNGVLATYGRFVSSDMFRVNVMGHSIHLIQTPILNHLWFLWFLCWYVGLFAVTVSVASLFKLPNVPSWLVMSPARYGWLIPMTLIPQWFMNLAFPGFGADVSVSLLPQPHLLVYYGIFFGFGALYYCQHDQVGTLSRNWRMHGLIALFIALPVGLIWMTNRPVTSMAQTVYAWLMITASLGFFRSCIQAENKVIRYLSDSAYWMYLAHLPFVIFLQVAMRDLEMPMMLKFTAEALITTVVMLVSYQLCVRHTWIGRLLNGPRKVAPCLKKNVVPPPKQRRRTIIEQVTSS